LLAGNGTNEPKTPQVSEEQGTGTVSLDCFTFGSTLDLAAQLSSESLCGPKVAVTFEGLSATFNHKAEVDDVAFPAAVATATFGIEESGG
jgi:hypothetical protein